MTLRAIAGGTASTGPTTNPVSIAQGGTGQVTASTAFNALSPLLTLGDTLYAAAAGSDTALAGNITTAKQFLTQTGTGTVSAAPVWAVIVSADLTTALTTPPPIGGTTQNTGIFTNTQSLTSGSTGVWSGTWVGSSTSGALYYTGVAQTGSNYALVMGPSSTSLNHASAVTIATAGVARVSFSTTLATFSVATTIAGGAVNVNVSSNFATNINTGTNTQNLTLGGASNTTVIASASLTLSALTTTTSASVGAATALPALPAGYITVTIGGTAQKIAYFNT